MKRRRDGSYFTIHGYVALAKKVALKKVFFIVKPPFSHNSSIHKMSAVTVPLNTAMGDVAVIAVKTSTDSHISITALVC